MPRHAPALPLVGQLAPVQHGATIAGLIGAACSSKPCSQIDAEPDPGGIEDAPPAKA